MLCHVQAGLSSTADKEQEGYRSSLLHRLVPALGAFITACCEEAGDSMESTLARREEIQRLAASCATARLEGCLAQLYDSLLLVRTRVTRAQHLAS